MSNTTREPDPIRVMFVELSEKLPELSSLGRYDTAFLVLLRDAVPVGHLVVPTGLSCDEVRERIAALTMPPAPPPPPAASELPFISVVIPSTLQREELLLGCVASLTKQDYPNFEIVVVDNQPGAAHAALTERLASYPGVSVVAQPLRGRSAACNRGLEVARGDIVTFTDDDIEATPGWLTAIGTSFAEDPQVACVTGPLLPRELETPAQVWFERSGGVAGHTYTRTAFQRRPGTFEVVTSTGSVFSIYQAGHFGDGPNMSFRTGVIRSLGGFDVRLGVGTPALAGEDPDLLLRLLFAGHTLVFDPRVFNLHTHVREYDVLRRTMYGYGCGYTAMLTGLAWSDLRHLLGLSAFGLRAVILLGRKFGGKRREAVASKQYPGELSRAEFHGLLAGPYRYLRSRRTIRRRLRELAAA